jgi:hypothetical protein
MVKSAFAQPTYNPSIPDFTVTIVSVPYDTQNPQAIVLRIKNQPFSSYNNSEGYKVNLYFNVRQKLHDSTEWIEYNTVEYVRDKWVNTGNGYLEQSVSDYTNRSWSEYPLNNSKRDFQVQAIIGFYKVYSPFLVLGLDYPDFMTLRMTDWSPTQTLTMDKIGSTAVPDTSSPSITTTPETTEEPTPIEPPIYAPYLIPIAIVGVVIVFGVIVFVYDFRKHDSV